MARKKKSFFTSIKNTVKSTFTSVKNLAANQAKDASENTRIFAIKKDLSRYEKDNSKLKSDINKLNNNIRYVENTNIPIVTGLNRDINYYTDEINKNYDKFLKISENTAATNLRMSEISKYNINIPKLEEECPSIRSFSFINEYQSYKTLSSYLLTNQLKVAQNTQKNRDQLKNIITVVENTDDGNKLLVDYNMSKLTTISYHIAFIILLSYLIHNFVKFIFILKDI